jgi:hypothetical protein
MLLAQNLTDDELVAVILKQRVSRVGVPSYAIWGIESLHGVVSPDQMPASSFV